MILKFSKIGISERNMCDDGAGLCPKDSTECVPTGDDYYCDCLPGFALPENVWDKAKNKKACIGKSTKRLSTFLEKIKVCSKCNCWMEKYRILLTFFNIKNHQCIHK